MVSIGKRLEGTDMPTTLSVPIRHGLMGDFANTSFPSIIYGFCDQTPLEMSGPGTVFGFVLQGRATLRHATHVRTVCHHEYFSQVINDRMVIAGGRGFAVLRLGYRGLNSIGGPVESRGRLKYIDGCSDTLLIAPTMKGDPCFNLLHFPPGVEQTMHTHPSLRVGLIHAGQGLCRTPHGVQELEVGTVFILEPEAPHAFATSHAGGMALTVFHPDSDHGPTHDEHPMLNRTMIDGISAREIDAIRTRTIA